MGKTAVTLAGIFFAFIALVHLGRIFCPFEINIGGFMVPDWASYVGFIIAGLLSVYLFQARRCSEPTVKE